MNVNRFFFTDLLLFIFTCFLFLACNRDSNKNNSIVVSSVHIDSTNIQVPEFSSDRIEVKTFEVKDSIGKLKGWGYDIFVENKKMIHQPIIPAIPGNNSFKTEEDALKTGTLAAKKMEITGTLPSLLVEELDSMGITK